METWRLATLAVPLPSHLTLPDMEKRLELAPFLYDPLVVWKHLEKDSTGRNRESLPLPVHPLTHWPASQPGLPGPVKLLPEGTLVQPSSTGS